MRAGAFDRLFERFDRHLREQGYLAMGGQIVDATIVQARRPRLTAREKEALARGERTDDWKEQRARQIDRDGRWTLKRGRKRRTGKGSRRQAEAIVVPEFGYKNHLSIDRAHGFVCRFAVTHAAAHDGHQLTYVLDPDNTASAVWADSAYRSRANRAALERCGLMPAFQHAKPKGKALPAHIRRGNVTRARIRCRIEHVFAAQKRRFHLVIGSVGLARARIALVNLAYNLTRLVFWERRLAAG